MAGDGGTLPRELQLFDCKGSWIGWVEDGEGGAVRRSRFYPNCLAASQRLRSSLERLTRRLASRTRWGPAAPASFSGARRMDAGRVHSASGVIFVLFLQLSPAWKALRFYFIFLH